MILIVDGNNISLRAAYGCAQLYDRMGTPTGCLMTTIRTICTVADKIRPERVFCVWDAGHSKVRKGLLPTYKSRDEVGEDPAKAQILAEWRLQTNLLKKYLPYLSVGQFEIPGCEADDIIFKVVKMLREASFDVAILSSDQDFNQLVSEGVSIFNFKRDELVGPAEIMNIYGVTPEQWVEYRCMTGDDSDKIPGVGGIGEKRASAILQEFGSLEAFFESPVSSKEKGFHKKLRESREVIDRNRKLMDLALLPDKEVPEVLIDGLMNKALCLEARRDAFWKMCINHDLNTLLQESNLWPALWGGV